MKRFGDYQDYWHASAMPDQVPKSSNSFKSAPRRSTDFPVSVPHAYHRLQIKFVDLSTSNISQNSQTKRSKLCRTNFFAWQHGELHTNCPQVIFLFGISECRVGLLLYSTVATRKTITAVQLTGCPTNA